MKNTLIIKLLLVSGGVLCLLYLYNLPKVLDKKTNSNEIKIDSNNFSAKIDSAMLYITKLNDPMKGIGMLREVVASDSCNLEALYKLGELSITISNYDKSLSYFKKFVTCAPKKDLKRDGLLRIAEVYERDGQITMARKTYSEIQNMGVDIELHNEIERKLEELK